MKGDLLRDNNFFRVGTNLLELQKHASIFLYSQEFVGTYIFSPDNSI